MTVFASPLTLPLLLGFILGLGLLLTASPLLWPREARAQRPASALGRALRERLALAGMGAVNASTVLASSLVLGVLVGALTYALLSIAAISIAAATVAALLPLTVITWRARARRRSNRAMWPDVVDHLVSAVRAGLSLPDSLSALAQVGPAPSRAAFAQFERDYASTANFGRSVELLKHRLADPVADRILETLRMSREVGGSDLTTVLRNLSVYLRQESAIRAEVEARQSWVVNAARLGAVAPWIVLLLLASRPEAVMAYNSAGGVTLIAGGLLVTLVAYRIMLAIGRLPEERRWFE
jgi:tight adherence protein B